MAPSSATDMMDFQDESPLGNKSEQLNFSNIIFSSKDTPVETNKQPNTYRYSDFGSHFVFVVNQKF